MTMQCEDHRKTILKALLNDASPEEYQSLKTHLAECLSCAQEQAISLDAIQKLRSVSDVPPPRHFFVYPQENRLSPWSVLQQMSLAWRVVVAVLFLALGSLAGLALANFHGKVERGVFAFSFGKPLDSHAVPAAPAVNVEMLKSDLLQVLEEGSQQERQLWFQEVRKELARSNRGLNQKQQRWVEAALTNFEARVNDRIDTQRLAMQANWKQSMGDLYKTIQAQRQQDLVLTKNRLDRLAAQGEIRGNQTDAILETLLQMSELRMK